MKINILTTATALSDHDLLAHLSVLAGNEREATVDLIAHLAALDTRPPVYRAEGYSSLFSYCTGALRLSEDAACSRIEAARACRRYPAILDLLAAGSLTLTSVRLLAPHLTPENHQAVLERATRRSRREIEILVAELSPRPDVPTSVRKLPVPAAPSAPPPFSPILLASPGSVPAIAPTPMAVRPAPRPVIQATAPERYRVQFTMGQESHDKLRRLQALLRREIPSGDAAAIVDRALTLLLDEVERTKLGKAAKPRSETSIRPETDNDCPDAAAGIPPHPASGPAGGLGRAMAASAPSSPGRGRRCTERIVPGAPSRPRVRKGWSGHGREHLPPVPGAQPA